MAMAVKMVVKERRAIPKHNENVELTSTAAYLNKKEDDTMQQENKIWKPASVLCFQGLKPFVYENN
uniref:Uncharacterized protein n=1 Tax=Magallana gigas TaxID=29159 RepID=K1R1X7_MAGGI